MDFFAPEYGEPSGKSPGDSPERLLAQAVTATCAGDPGTAVTLLQRAAWLAPHGSALLVRCLAWIRLARIGRYAKWPDGCGMVTPEMEARRAWPDTALRDAARVNGAYRAATRAGTADLSLDVDAGIILRVLADLPGAQSTLRSAVTAGSAPDELRGLLEHVLGRMPEIRDRLAAEPGLGPATALVCRAMATLCHEAGLDERASALLTEAADHCARGSDAHGYALALLMRGDWAAAVRTSPLLLDHWPVLSLNAGTDRPGVRVLPGRRIRADLAERAYAEAERALRESPRPGVVAQRLLAALKLRRAYLARLNGDGSAVVRLAAEALDMAREAGDQGLRWTAWTHLALASIAAGDPPSSAGFVGGGGSAGTAGFVGGGGPAGTAGFVGGGGPAGTAGFVGGGGAADGAGSATMAGPAGAAGSVRADESVGKLARWAHGPGSLSLAEGLGALCSQEGHHAARAGQFERAAGCHRLAREIHAALGYTGNEAQCVTDLGMLRLWAGDRAGAQVALAEAAALLEASIRRRPALALRESIRLVGILVRHLSLLNAGGGDPEALSRAAERIRSAASRLPLLSDDAASIAMEELNSADYDEELSTRDYANPAATPNNGPDSSGTAPGTVPDSSGDALTDIPASATDAPDDIRDSATDAPDDIPNSSDDALDDIPGSATDAPDDIRDSATDAPDDIRNSSDDALGDVLNDHADNIVDDVLDDDGLDDDVDGALDDILDSAFGDAGDGGDGLDGLREASDAALSPSLDELLGSWMHVRLAHEVLEATAVQVPALRAVAARARGETREANAYFAEAMLAAESAEPERRDLHRAYVLGQRREWSRAAAAYRAYRTSQTRNSQNPRLHDPGPRPQGPTSTGSIPAGSTSTGSIPVGSTSAGFIPADSTSASPSSAGSTSTGSIPADSTSASPSSAGSTSASSIPADSIAADFAILASSGMGGTELGSDLLVSGHPQAGDHLVAAATFLRYRAYADAETELQALRGLLGEDWWRRSLEPWASLEIEAETARGLAVTARAAGHGPGVGFGRAVGFYREALRSIEVMRGGVRDDSARRSLADTDVVARIQFGAALCLLEASEAARAEEASRADDLAREAFQVGERSRARAFLDLLESRRATGEAELPALTRWRAATAEVALLQHLTAARLAAGSPPDPALEARFTPANERLAALERELAREHPAMWRALDTRAEPLTADAVSRLLPPNTLLVSYLLRDERLLVWAIDNSGLREARVLEARGTASNAAPTTAIGTAVTAGGTALSPASNTTGGATLDTANGRTEETAGSTTGATALDIANGRTGGIEGLVRAVREGCAAGSDLSGAAAELAGVLLGPVHEVLLAHEKVLIVPSGALHSLPFGVLPWRGAPLVAQRTVSVLPGAGALALMRPVRPESMSDGRLLAVGDPARMRFPKSAGEPGRYAARLPGSGLEAEAVARRFPGQVEVLVGEAATRDAVLAAAAKATVVHLATHACLDEASPLSSAVLFADGRSVSVADLAGVSLQADLVVLSACRTGRGGVSAGDDVQGLLRGVLAAGAGAAVVSLWDVHDMATALFMDDFHRRLRTAGSVAGALRRTQEVFRRRSRTQHERAARRLLAAAGGGAVADEGPEYWSWLDRAGHPAVWAAFVAVAV
ncbi:CHAT domain-containing protein [Acrocarpospora phusangensis]|uniref:CHAT domain-containing protein n=1 Tax=Acrocarpospora phusangensis TaxID=1070424 RepID=UPI00194DB702|nr:CHAT domain-containing protein [Acrocarpospora phusangensis]